MTKITTYNRGIIIDGHADTKEECETITLLCDSLAKDKNFKQVAYDDGYAAFEKIGKAERLRFINTENGLTVYFDTGIQNVGFSYGSNTYTFTTSGETYGFTAEPGSDITLTINLKSGYSLKSSSLGSVSGNTVTIPFSTVTSPTNLDCTLVSEVATVKKSVDLTTLSGWANLAPGNHTIKIVAKGTGYRDSELSEGVTVSKPAEVYTDCLTFTGESSEFTLAVGGAKEWNGTLYYSTDHNTWNVWDGTAISSANKKLYLRGKNNTKFCTSKGAQLSLSAKAGCSGNIQTLLDYENPPTSIPAEACYQAMFYDCVNLIAAPALPAITLKRYCYASMFNGCTSLKVNISSGNKIFTCPSTIPFGAVDYMFYNTGGSFTGTPTAGNTYYWTV